MSAMNVTLERFSPTETSSPTMAIMDESYYHRQLMRYPFYRYHVALTLYAIPVILFVGLLGNSLTLAVLLRPAMRKKNAAYVYLAALAVADLLVLIIGLFRMWVEALGAINIKELSHVSCKLINMIGYTVSDYSGWLVAAMTVERYIAVCHPLSNASGGNRRTGYVMFGMLGVLSLINSHFIWTVKLNEFNSCRGSTGYESLILHVWPWVDCCIYSFVPFAFIITLNTLIIRQVILAKKRRSFMDASKDKRNSNADNSKITGTLLAVSFTFIVLTLPVNIVMIYRAFVPSESTAAKVKFRLATTITELLMYSNHSGNFILYCLTGAKFRHQLVLMFKSWVASDRQCSEGQIRLYAAESRALSTRTTYPQKAEDAITKKSSLKSVEEIPE